MNFPLENFEGIFAAIAEAKKVCNDERTSEKEAAKKVIGLQLHLLLLVHQMGRVSQHKTPVTSACQATTPAVCHWR